METSETPFARRAVTNAGVPSASGAGLRFALRCASRHAPRAERAAPASRSAKACTDSLIARLPLPCRYAVASTVSGRPACCRRFGSTARSALRAAPALAAARARLGTSSGCRARRSSADAAPAAGAAMPARRASRATASRAGRGRGRGMTSLLGVGRRTVRCAPDGDNPRSARPAATAARSAATPRVRWSRVSGRHSGASGASVARCASRRRARNVEGSDAPEGPRRHERPLPARRGIARRRRRRGRACSRPARTRPRRSAAPRPAPRRRSSSRSRPGPAGCRCRARTTRVTWAITDDNKPITDGRSPRAARCGSTTTPTTSTRPRSRSSRSSSDCKVEIATYNSADEAFAKLAVGLGRLRRDHRADAARNIVDLIAQKLLPPLNHSYLPNLEKNIWPRLQDPFYDRGSRYTVPYVVWMDGIGWRNDKVKEDIAGDGRPLGHLLARAGLPRQGRHPRRPARRAEHADAARRDARRASVPTSTPRTPPIIDKAGRDLSELTRHLQPQGHDHRLPDAARGQDGAAPLVVGRPASAAFYYLPKGVKRRRAVVLGPDENGVVQNDFFCIGRTATKPGARARVHQLHARREERVRQLRQLHRLHAAAERRSTPRR